MHVLKDKVHSDRKQLQKDPKMFYLKMGAMMVGAFLWGRMSK